MSILGKQTNKQKTKKQKTNNSLKRKHSTSTPSVNFCIIWATYKLSFFLLCFHWEIFVKPLSLPPCLTRAYTLFNFFSPDMTSVANSASTFNQDNDDSNHRNQNHIFKVRKSKQTETNNNGNQQ